MTHTARIVEVLGGRKVLGHKVTDLHHLREALRKGLPYAALDSVMTRFCIDREEASAALNLKLRTLARRKGNERLVPDESDRLFRLARIAAQAVDVLGGEEEAGQWLHQPNRALGGTTPLSLLDTDIGARQVEDVLGRIAHGVFS